MRALTDSELDELATRAAKACATAFAHNGWAWGGGPGRPRAHVPSELEIGVALRRMICQCERGHWLMSGHLIVHRYRDENDIDHCDITLDLGTAYAIT